MTVDGRPRLAIYLPSLSGGGAERAMLNLAHGIASRGWSVDLVLAQGYGPYLGDVHKSIRKVDLRASRVLSSLPKLIRYLRIQRPGTLLSSLDYANVVALWAHRLAGAPGLVAVNEQNTISRSARSSVRRRQRIVPYLIKLFYPWANYVIGNSQGVVNDLSRVSGLPRDRIKMLYNPVVTPEVREGMKAPVNHPWFEPGQPPVVLAVGRLTKQKDFPTLIHAFAQIKETHPARLMILGEGPDRPALTALVNTYGLEADITMPGFVENPYAYMRRASLYVLSSLWEGLPTVLIEALFCDIPVIATDCPSGPREILAGGRYGAIVPVGDVSTLAKAIEKGLNGMIPPPSDESWKPYSLEVVVDQYIDLFTNGHT